jgi:hypothetical protein
VLVHHGNLYSLQGKGNFFAGVTGELPATTLLNRADFPSPLVHTSSLVDAAVPRNRGVSGSF